MMMIVDDIVLFGLQGFLQYFVEFKQLLFLLCWIGLEKMYEVKNKGKGGD